jgi:glutamate-1-semialdehyde 2,1-aminomutase
LDAKERLRNHLLREYRKRTPGSRALFREAEKVMVRGGSHTIRLWKPYPFFVAEARGSRVGDVDGRDYVDYWQGHYANILGHNPSFLLRKMGECLRRGVLHTGFEARHQVELAELLLSRLAVKGHKVRFTTSGTLATMYAVMLAQGYTGRDLVLKIGGGWHGASPYLLKGVKHTSGLGYRGPDSAGIARDISRKTIVTRFNDCDALADVFRTRGDRIACFILEPFLGVGGFLAAEGEYLALARELTRRHGAVLVFDEIISGFRFCPSGVQTLYGVEPDLATFGKLIGGGHAVAAVVGKEEILEGCDRSAPAAKKVLFEGGTFSAHSEYMKAGLLLLRRVVERADSIYPKLSRSGRILRVGIEKAFAREGIEARCTGGGNDVVTGSSLFMVHFPRGRGHGPLRTPEDLNDETCADVVLREELLKLALLNEGVNVVHGGGAVSTAHGREDIERTIAAYGEAARIFRKYL